MTWTPGQVAELTAAVLHVVGSVVDALINSGAKPATVIARVKRIKPQAAQVDKDVDALKRAGRT